MAIKNLMIQTGCLLIIKALFKSGLGSRAIAKNLGITRWKVQQAYKELGIYNIGRKKPFKAICKEKKSLQIGRKYTNLWHYVNFNRIY